MRSFIAGAAPRYGTCDLLLVVLWKDYRSGALTEKDLETAAFNVFLYGRMIGAAAEIDDHLNRGRNMDTRTPLEQCAFVV
jgi:hypothetical protein